MYLFNPCYCWWLSWPVQNDKSTQRELSKYYQHDRIQMFFKNPCVWTNVASTLEKLISESFSLYFMFQVRAASSRGWEYDHEALEFTNQAAKRNSPKRTPTLLSNKVRFTTNIQIFMCEILYHSLCHRENYLRITKRSAKCFFHPCANGGRFGQNKIS